MNESSLARSSSPLTAQPAFHMEPSKARRSRQLFSKQSLSANSPLDVVLRRLHAAALLALQQEAAVGSSI